MVIIGLIIVVLVLFALIFPSGSFGLFIGIFAFVCFTFLAIGFVAWVLMFG